MNQGAQRAEPQGLDPVEHPWWQVALDHLEEQWPEKMERLLRQGKLKDHLDKLVQACWAQADAAKAAGADECEAANAVDPYLEPPNPNYDPDNPKALSPQGRELLRSFRHMYLP